MTARPDHDPRGVHARADRRTGRQAARALGRQVPGSGRQRPGALAVRAAGSNNLEGLLYPDTYFVTPKDDEAAILARMVTASSSRSLSLGHRDAAARSGLTPYQVVIVASMVEREAKVDEDRGKIASVIYNRLERHELGIDATLLYACTATRQGLASAHQANPYNTRSGPAAHAHRLAGAAVAAGGAWRTRSRPVPVLRAGRQGRPPRLHGQRRGVRRWPPTPAQKGLL